jgi:hypothetical protein
MPARINLKTPMLMRGEKKPVPKEYMQRANICVRFRNMSSDNHSVSDNSEHKDQCVGEVNTKVPRVATLGDWQRDRVKRVQESFRQMGIFFFKWSDGHHFILFFKKFK